MTNEQMSRRSALALAGAGAALAACGPTTPAPAPLRSRQFPEGFLWGCASSAYQIEGSLNADGRGASIWDTFAADPARIRDRSNASVACDSYTRYGEDVALLRDGGMNAYRFSIAWPRIQPSGAGAGNDPGIDYYSRLVDALLAANIQPFATLFHWDLPQALQDAGGWATRDTAQRFADYAALVAQRLGDRLTRYVILNEAAVHTVLGHVTGAHAPGLTNGDLIGSVTHHQNLAQGMAIQALRAARTTFEIGPTMALMPSRPEGGALAFWNRLPADGFGQLWNRAYLDPLFRGSYPEQAQALVEPHLREGDLAITRQPIDFLGVNYYSPAYMRLDLSNPAMVNAGAPPNGVPLDAFGRHVDPSGLEEMLTLVRAEYGNPRVIITENGCSDAFSDGPAELNDRFRIDRLSARAPRSRKARDGGGLNHLRLLPLVPHRQLGMGRGLSLEIRPRRDEPRDGTAHAQGKLFLVP